MIATFNAPVSLPWPYILNYGSGIAPFYATFSMLPDSNVEDGSLTFTSYLGDSCAVQWNQNLNNWYVSWVNVSSISDLPNDGVFNLSPSVVAAQNYTVAKNLGSGEMWTFNGSGWDVWSIVP